MIKFDTEIASRVDSQTWNSFLAGSINATDNLIALLECGYAQATCPEVKDFNVSAAAALVRNEVVI